VNRTKTDGNKDDSFSLVYQITKNAVENATGGTVEFAANNATDTTPKLKLTITTEGDKKKYTFKIENLAYSSETDGKYTYYVEETNSQLTGYLAPSYTNTSAPTGAEAAFDHGTIVNQQEGGYELPSTGGTGTTWIYILGTLILTFAGITLAVRLRGRKSRI
jgi:LPXTG-motif cell wall-anchored protein